MDYLNGPDQIIPTDDLIITDPSGCVKFRSTGHDFEKSILPISIPTVLHKCAVDHPEQIALVTKDPNGFFKRYTFAQYEECVRNCAKAFLRLGLQRHHSVCILGFNSPEWFISQLGAIHAGGLATGIYATNSSDACHHIAQTSRANIIVVEDDTQLQKILQIRDRLPNLKAIVQYSGKPKQDDVLSWEQLIQLGKQQTDEELDLALKKIAINQCCIIIFTSGTVGQPKGVMLSHDNVLFNAQSIISSLKFVPGSESFVSYLPLSHIAAQTVDICMSLLLWGTVFFGDKNALKGSLVNTLLESKPTCFLGVPRVWEKIREKMIQTGAENGYIKKQIATWAKAQGLQYNMAKINGIDSSSWGYTVANFLVFKKIKQALGLENCKVFASAAAPLSSDVKKYFLSIDIPIVEAFGMSELSGAHTIGNMETFDLNSIGCAVAGVKTKIINLDEQQHGEICMYGRHVFMGYINDPEKTRETIDEDGWLHSGDIGYIDKKNKLYITGRLKEILITAGGENVAPVPIEQRVLAEMPFISQAMLIGDKRKFLSLLLTLKCEVDRKTNEPTDILTKDVENWLKRLGSEALTVTEVLEEGPHEKVLAAIQKVLDKVNVNAISNAQKIQKFAILPKDFSIVGGELGPTMKLKRHVVANQYSDVIDGFYTYISK